MSTDRLLTVKAEACEARAITAARAAKDFMVNERESGYGRYRNTKWSESLRSGRTEKKRS